MFVIVSTLPKPSLEMIPVLRSATAPWVANCSKKLTLSP
jgi:hypothetical protein